MSKVSAQLVKELREKTGAGIKDCQEALEQNSLQVDKADRATADGAIGSYIHLGGKVGVLIEVNCETDFVAKTDDFKGLVNELALQVAAMKPDYVSREEVPQETLAAELEGYKQAAMAEGKPAKIAEKIADIVKETIAKVGENIRVRRFVRFALGA